MLWLLGVALAASTACAEVSARDITSLPAPAVVVLGERHGTQPDLRRATRVVRAYLRDGPVTLALEAVQGVSQSALDRFAAGELDEDGLKAALDWDETWGFPWQAYRKLLTASTLGARVVAAGLPLEAAPEDARFPEPPGYIEILRPSMGEHPMPPESEGRFARSMAWRDHRIAAQAVAGWDGQGHLVVVTGRGHVEGGLGVTWQVARLTPAPTHGFVLAWGGDPPCLEGDRIWR